jgi:CheY-like chemotaxis protein
MTGKIVLVEDNSPTRKLVKLILSNAGHDVREAIDGMRGVELIRETEPDLALVDLQLPGMSGFEVLEQVRSDASVGATKVVAFTAVVVAGERERVLSAGFDGYIPKPIDPGDFARTIDGYLNGER